MTTSISYNPLDWSTIVDPYPVYAELRAHAPVFWHEQMQSWVLTRYFDCRDVLRNHGLWARDLRRVGADVPEERLNIQYQDPPEQAKLRALVVNAMRAPDTRDICRRARPDLEGHFERLGGHEEFDLMSEVAAPLALQITCDLVGVEPPALDAYVRIFEGLTRRMDSGLDPSHAKPGEKVGLELHAMMKAWFEKTRLPGMIASLRESPHTKSMPDAYVRNTVSAVFNASYSTVYASTGAVVLALLERPHVLDQLRERSLMPTGVAELIRFCSPAQGTSRVATERTRIGDTTIERGEAVVTLFAAANRDPEYFDRPDELILDRSPNQHLGFGWGPHICAGAQLATDWLYELIDFLNERPSALTLAGEPRYMRSATLRNLEALPVRFLC
ncbi:cytochrome P450 [Streptomyces sp. NPDC059874]|uniref:cytochrome P450 n=1 Tax=Streptomyces sp. NPDC059874 TaxID=3346983 RepID=UPI003649EE57